MSNAYALAIHTSSPDLGLAIAPVGGGEGIRCQTWSLGREVSNLLHPHLQTFLAPQTWQDLAYLAVAIGPGSFTGTRIGVVTARTLAQQLNIPLFGISSLAAIAWHKLQSQSFPDGVTIAVSLPAQRGACHGAIYKIDWAKSRLANSMANSDRLPNYPMSSPPLTALVPDAVFSPDEWQDCLDTHQPTTAIAAPSELGYSVISVLELATAQWQQGQRPDWSTVIPTYGQSPV